MRWLVDRRGLVPGLEMIHAQVEAVDEHVVAAGADLDRLANRHRLQLALDHRRLGQQCTSPLLGLDHLVVHAERHHVDGPGVHVADDDVCLAGLRDVVDRHAEARPRHHGLRLGGRLGVLRGRLRLQRRRPLQRGGLARPVLVAGGDLDERRRDAVLAGVIDHDHVEARVQAGTAELAVEVLGRVVPLPGH